MAEFLGGASLKDATTCYLLACDGSPHGRAQVREARDLPLCLEHGWELRRSLWDREHLIAYLDFEYVNFDYPGEAYLNPQRVLDVQREVIRETRRILLEHDIAPLHLLSGRGHHLVWGIRRGSAAYVSLARLGRVPSSVRQAYAAPQPPRHRPVDQDLGRAFAGLALVLEYLGHRIVKRAAPACEVPLQITEVEVGTGTHGREIVSVDLSMYGDPLHTRYMRVPFSLYLKPDQQRGAIGQHVVSRLPPLFEVPVRDFDEASARSAMSDPAQVLELARSTSASIPDLSGPAEGLIEEYEGSDLARFHDRFYSEEQHAPERWSETYDRVGAGLPPCAAALIERPNDLLLKPAGIQHLTRVLLALGWHPRHVAGLLRSKYERDFGWGSLWYTYDASLRADFYTRLFAGLVAVGLDELIDMNNVSHNEKGYCFEPGRPSCCDLDRYRRTLLQRMHHERLGDRPFDGLLL